MSGQKINVVVEKRNGKEVFLTPSPINPGFMELTEDEVREGMVNGTLQFYDPDPAIVNIILNRMKKNRKEE